MERRNSPILILAVSLSLALSAVAHAATDVLFLLDVSGSMRASVQGEVKIDSARKALLGALSEVPEGSHVGIRLYGHRVPQNNKTDSCKDSELSIPMGLPDAAKIASLLESVSPLGYTPTAYSLEQSQNDFSIDRESEKVIILLSDGEETCGGDPKATVERLIANGFNVRVYTVGFDVNAKAESELKAIAQAGNGKYFRAANSGELSAALKEATVTSLIIRKEKSVYGTPIRGGDSFETAVPIDSDVEYRLDHHQRPDEFDYFAVKVAGPSRFHLKVKTLEKGLKMSGNSFQETTSPSARVALLDSNRAEVFSASAPDLGYRSGKQFAMGEDGGLITSPGAYYLLAGGSVPQHSDGATFLYSLEVLGDGGTDTEAGQTMESAVLIPPGRHSSNYFLDSDDIDVFAFDAKQGERYFIGIVPESSFTSSVKLRVFDEYGQGTIDEEVRFDPSGKTSPFSIPSDGRYFIEVKTCRGCWSSGPIRYLLDLKQLAASSPEAGE
ncbi:MAG: VWA domain-containing protein [Bdellovibrionota bacterium]|nr:MAG: VWA domain-containing protein [Bdellovibrionota bacterium]